MAIFIKNGIARRSKLSNENLQTLINIYKDFEYFFERRDSQAMAPLNYFIGLTSGAFLANALDLLEELQIFKETATFLYNRLFELRE